MLADGDRRRRSWKFWSLVYGPKIVFILDPEATATQPMVRP